ncbi:pyridoxamine 5'-phosphate oxidase family protein [Rhodococcus sp. HM1]|uniref:pyridoxamine 5'-phosphate oxidase family protein n=1 Tax=unclassified Rhodococcus (in: high G+C Gram-positive bacteria) TaxID=192944 RepID=UPI0018CDD0FF|nr:MULTISPECIES: pyridoxamine 5'-phosphate oxidase family protein [unclassified Rhodococcus (in: high G+C Gram-positive bacteria)]MBH0120201.1 pyridoxamine 5'-phosphate oxidase family protein [Rhodococcus sp. CX]MCK8675539.1 pyridoxamine 5'-phosphate oxidase family protein [Rhodococcus sp. HM1]
MSEPSDADAVTVLEEDECWELLRTEKVGRLVVTADGRPDIFPVNYVVGDRKVYFRSGEGSKLSELAVHAEVAFEADVVGDRTAWSVVVHGRARILTHFNEIQAVEELGPTPWVSTPKYNFVEITATEITGRRFALVEH